MLEVDRGEYAYIMQIAESVPDNDKPAKRIDLVKLMTLIHHLFISTNE